MDHDSLRTAATYLNNLLLARGLLRNGEPIDFVKPSKDSRAQIINLVHDLILREDREKDHRERSAEVLRMLRAEDTRKTHDIERLSTKCDEAARATAQAQMAERAAQAEIKKLEKAMKLLQEQTAKFKATLAQVKTQCANDVRKRDLELARLKQHLQGQQRGNRVGMAPPTMHVRQPSERRTASPQDAEYSLKQETTEFLTQLSQSLSDENDGLMALLRESVSTLKELLGLPAQSQQHPDSAIGSLGSDHDPSAKARSSHASNSIALLTSIPTSYETLSADLSSTLAHLRHVLTNPNFVSVEEVELREEEIGRLRQGWERMEQRWRDVLGMMEGWIRRMNTGETINIDDLRRGMGLVSPSRDRPSLGVWPRGATEPQDVSLVDSEVGEAKMADDSLLEDSGLVAHERPAQSLSLPSGGASPKRKRDVLEPPEIFDLRPAGSMQRSAPASPQRLAAMHALLDDDEDESEDLEIPQMTVEEKLTAAAEEAQQAVRERQQRRKEKEAESTSSNGAVHGHDSKIPRRSHTASSRANGAASKSSSAATSVRDDDTLAPMVKLTSPMAKRTKIRGRPRKRKSTLSPEELEALMGAAAEGQE